MGIKAKGIEAFKAYAEKYIRIVFDELTRSLSYLGEQCVERIRDRSSDESWIDHTGALRSSIGYAIYEFGKKKIVSSFPVVKNGSEGSEEGRQMLNDLARLYSDTFALVVIAGMSYAEYVESLENKDVLASTELWAYEKLDDYLAKTKERVNNRVARLKL